MVRLVARRVLVDLWLARAGAALAVGLLVLLEAVLALVLVAAAVTVPLALLLGRLPA